MKLAAIDIGSNAVRLLFTQVLDHALTPFFKKDALFRVPIRLGEDVFGDGIISEGKANSLVHTMIAFKHLIEAYRPADFMACATSAMREATNGREVVTRIRDEAGMKIEIIDGNREANIIYSNNIVESLDKHKIYLYIDVGGGSTELTLIAEGEIRTSRSFNLGTVRILKERDSSEEWRNLKDWLSNHVSKTDPVQGIGSGGNINKIFALTRGKRDRPLSYKKVKQIYNALAEYNLEERIRKFNLRPDRADVIIPAGLIFKSIMKWANIDEIWVPQIGLSDGIIHVLYEKQKNETLNF